MRVFKHSYAIGIFILVAIFMILPVFNVNAGENDNFLITVETDKDGDKTKANTAWGVNLSDILK